MYGIFCESFICCCRMCYAKTEQSKIMSRESRISVVMSNLKMRSKNLKIFTYVLTEVNRLS